MLLYFLVRFMVYDVWLKLPINSDLDYNITIRLLRERHVLVKSAFSDCVVTFNDKTDATDPTLCV